MKLLALVSLFVPIALARYKDGTWQCSLPSGGGGHARLRDMYTIFNKLFGRELLLTAPKQCYLAECYGAYFGFCNIGESTFKEHQMERSLARKEDPGSGSRCRLYPDTDPDTYYYIYSVEKNPDWDAAGDAKLDVRHCAAR
ncbi:hypothetical protein FQN53_007329 [Emmonsiellopsis sp. PD_33]|nr:hypothetical protein FQN53_007329 [Emmonsiellopsis sp. PD_33]